MRQKMAREEGHRHHQNSDWEHSDSPALSSCSTVLVCGGRIGRHNVLVVIAGSEGPRLRHVATPSCARAKDRLVSIQKVVAAAHVPADGIAATGASPPKIAGPVGNTTATATHPYLYLKSLLVDGISLPKATGAENPPPSPSSTSAGT